MDWYTITFPVLGAIWVVTSIYAWTTKKQELFQAAGVFGVLVALLGVSPMRERNLENYDKVISLNSGIEIRAVEYRALSSRLKWQDSQMEVMNQEIELWRLNNENVRLIVEVLAQLSDLTPEVREKFEKKIVELKENSNRSSGPIKEVENIRKEIEERIRELQEAQENLDEIQTSTTGLLLIIIWMERLVVLISSLQWAFGGMIFRRLKHSGGG